MSHPHGQEGPSLLANAEAARIVSDTTPSAEVDRLFFEHPDLTSVVVDDGAGPLRVLTRRTQATEMAGRLGYGRSLYCGRSVGSLPFVGPALVLDGASSLVEAGRRALAPWISSPWPSRPARSWGSGGGSWRPPAASFAPGKRRRLTRSASCSA